MLEELFTSLHLKHYHRIFWLIVIIVASFDIINQPSLLIHLHNMILQDVIVYFVAIASLLNVSLCAIADHEITSLPGWNGTLPSKQYSGLLQLPNTNPARYYHYWLVQSENDPVNDPIVCM